VFNSPITAQYFKATNYRVPSGTFAISGFRVFGSGKGKKPTKVSSFNISRSESDSRSAILSWNKQKNAIGYNIRFGSEPNKLYRSYQVYGNTSVSINSLNKGQRYWFAIDAFGENGITPGVTQEAVIE
jgi:xylan 1,4-beta-xylosidase